MFRTPQPKRVHSRFNENFENNAGSPIRCSPFRTTNQKTQIDHKIGYSPYRQEIYAYEPPILSASTYKILQLRNEIEKRDRIIKRYHPGPLTSSSDRIEEEEQCEEELNQNEEQTAEEQINEVNQDESHSNYDKRLEILLKANQQMMNAMIENQKLLLSLFNDNEEIQEASSHIMAAESIIEKLSL